MSDFCRIDGMCLDKHDKTNVVIGSDMLKLNDFEDMVNGDPRIKNKMKEISKQLDNY